MVSIAYISDLHLEFEERGPSSPSGTWFALQKMRRQLTKEGHPFVGPVLSEVKGKIDLLVLAGDTNTPRGRKRGLSVVGYGNKASEYLGVPVVAIAGNHEFYGGELSEELAALRGEAEETNGRVSFLDNAHVVFSLCNEPVHILGATLWSDFSIFGDVDVAVLAAAQGMTDFEEIRLGRERFTPQDAIRLNRRSREWMASTIEGIRGEEEAAKIVVVTHHAPSIQSVPERLMTEVLTAAYASNMNEEVSSWGPSAWIHGHLHGECAYKIDGVQIVSAARGYIGHEAGADNLMPRILEL